jgi:hypothetical protein
VLKVLLGCGIEAEDAGGGSVVDELMGGVFADLRTWVKSVKGETMWKVDVLRRVTRDALQLPPPRLPLVRGDPRKPIYPAGRNDKTKLVEKNPYRVLTDVSGDTFLVGSEEVFGGDGGDGGPRRTKGDFVPVLLGKGGKSDDRNVFFFFLFF